MALSDTAPTREVVISTFNTAQQYATDAMTNLSQFITSLAALLEEVGTGDSGESIPSFEVSPSIPFDTARSYISSALAGLPALPVPEGIDSFSESPPSDITGSYSADSIGSFNKTMDTLDIPVIPTFVAPVEPAVPQINEPSTPGIPSYTMPDAPSLFTYNLPTPEVVTIPYFNEELLPDNLTTPTNTFDFNEEAYSSALKDATFSKLLNDIQNGGYGLEPSDEQLLWERARDRELRNMQAAIDDITRISAGSGFPMPTGAMMDAVRQAQMKSLETTSSLNREITLKKADLYVQNRQFAVEKAIGYEQVLMNYHTSLMERSLNAAKAAFDAGLAVFNASVARYNVKVERFKTLVAVFESKIRAELLKVEIYKSQIDGEKAKADIDQAKVNLYKARVDAINSAIEVYKNQVAAVSLLAGIEKMKIEIYREQIQAYSAKIQGQVAEYGAIEAKIKGETAKAIAFEAEAKGYMAEVEAAKTKLEYKRLELQKNIENKKIDLVVYDAKLKKYLAGVETVKTNNAITMEGFKANMQTSEASLKAYAAAYGISQEETEKSYRAYVEAIKAKTDIAFVTLKKFLGQSELRIEGMKSMATVQASVAAASLQAMHAQASIGAHSDYSETHSYKEK